jgi:hypothetical protein
MRRRGQRDFLQMAVHEFGNVEKFPKRFAAKKGRNELRPYKKLEVTFYAVSISWSL